MHQRDLRQEFGRSFQSARFIFVIHVMPERASFHIEGDGDMSRLIIGDYLIQHINKGKHALSVYAF